MTLLIEERIQSLVESLNRLPFVETVFSCEGHFEREPDPRYLPTAYVTFGVNDALRFRLLYERFLKMSSETREGFIRITYDCLLGRYTLSAWAGSGMRDPVCKRQVVDGLISRLSEIIRTHPVAAGHPPADDKRKHPYPCDNRIPPCVLTIPVQSSSCPFVDPPGSIPRFSRYVG